MTRTKLVAVAFAALVVTVGTVAAAPGNAPVDVGADDQYDDQAAAGDDADADNESADGGPPADVPPSDAEDADADNESADDGPPADVPPSDAEDAGPADRGPPADLPAQVPDHVSEIHDLIGSFLNGDLDGSPGDAVSDATPDDSADDDTNADDSA